MRARQRGQLEARMTMRTVIWLLVTSNLKSDSQMLRHTLNPGETRAPSEMMLKRSLTVYLEHICVSASMSHPQPDPLHLVRRLPPSKGPSTDNAQASTARTAKLDRERSIRTNRRQKFIDCVASEDVSMAQLRKLAWNGVPNELRPIAWPLLLVCSHCVDGSIKSDHCPGILAITCTSPSLYARSKATRILRPRRADFCAQSGGA